MNVYIDSTGAVFIDGFLHQPKDIDREAYEKQLQETQEDHLRRVRGVNYPGWRPCMHDQCTTCHGTGIGVYGPCVHNISCPCPKCTPTY